MPETDDEIAAESAPETPAKPSGKIRLLSIDDLDKRTKTAQYCRQTRDEVLSDLGGPERLSTLEKLATDHVSVIDAMIRDVGICWLRGEQVDHGPHDPCRFRHGLSLVDPK